MLQDNALPLGLQIWKCSAPLQRLASLPCRGSVRATAAEAKSAVLPPVQQTLAPCLCESRCEHAFFRHIHGKRERMYNQHRRRVYNMWRRSPSLMRAQHSAQVSMVSAPRTASRYRRGAQQQFHRLLDRYAHKLLHDTKLAFRQAPPLLASLTD